MQSDMYSVEQVAEKLGLHVRTVRGYIRSGRLPAVRIGKQYRIAPDDLEAFTGRPTAGSTASLEVSSIVHIDSVDATAADRLATLTLASANSAPDPHNPVRIQTSYEAEKNRMRIVILGGAAATADVLRLLDDVVTSDTSLFHDGSDNE